MDTIPSIWRTELWHPMVVHFPVATLLLATMAGLVYVFVKTGSLNVFLSNLILFLLITGVATGWIGIYTGLLAYNIEVRILCDPEVLQHHQNWGYITMIIYSVSLAIQLLIRYWLNPAMLLIRLAVLVLLVAGGVALSYCGHLGAKVVYQQGGGTYKPSTNCIEFEK